MCGLTGIVSFKGDPVDEFMLRRMTDAIAHRGPDGHGYWIEQSVGLGHRRLAIRDLSDAGKQPMHSSDGRFVVVFNGEIYNDQALKLQLSREAGVQFHTNCDTELIAPAFSYWGEEAFLRFEGMFALAIWDRKERVLTLARDPVGIKPLYYCIKDQAIAFASEVKGLLPFHGNVKLDPEVLRRFLAQGHTGPDKCLVSGIKPLEPGSVARYSSSGNTVHRYWRPRRSHQYTSFNQALADFQPLFDKVVNDHLVSDVPVGLLLSGGVDSSLIAKGLRGVKGVRAFTGRFSQAEFDEGNIAVAVAKEMGLDHTSVEFEKDYDLEERFIRISNMVDGQLADSSCLAFYSVCKEASRHVKVALTGDGADEFFGGYETYHASILANMLTRFIPDQLFGMSARLLSNAVARHEGRPSLAEKCQRFAQGIATNPKFPHPQWRRYLQPDQEKFVFSLDTAVSQKDALISYANSTSEADMLIDKCLLADQNYYLPGDMLVKADMMSMANGLEIRVPFLDRRIMEFAGQLHPRLLVPLTGQGKPLLRAALGRFSSVPKLDRLPKRGFNVPVALLLRGQLKCLGEKLLDKNADILSPELNPDGVRRLWREHQELRANHGYPLWALLTLAAWRSSVN